MMMIMIMIMLLLLMLMLVFSLYVRIGRSIEIGGLLHVQIIQWIATMLPVEDIIVLN